MVTLNLPHYPFKLKEEGNKVYIFDEIRKRYLFLTPEEWVRQHVIQYLIIYKLYPRSLIKIETSLVFNTMLKRSDIVVLDKNAKPFLLVECKAPHIKITQKTIDQAARYNTSYSARYVVLTNGIDVISCSIDHQNKTYELLKEIPDYPQQL